ncbi:O-methyltransferase [Speluncibacter jeojiensis]|uniref:O-methyltransferase n=1 Tax=Speluncibacter jeojiensis TaxID=2710754 RepID=A0A9X4RCK2_9ACTN|nr:O-methyltransferase [Corynebacteriales bacterium D3-21]
MANHDEAWGRVDEFLGATLIPEDPALAEVHRSNARAGLPPIDVAPNQGKLLNLLAQLAGARRVLEVGTLGGYSTIWLARALPPDGRLITLEIDPRHAEVARANVDHADVGERVEIRVGAALQSLAALADENAEAFDLVFIDADKQNNAAYVRAALGMSHPGTVIVVDNVVRGGAILDAQPDPTAAGSREVLELLGAEPSLDATALQTVGAKGWDGLAIARVRG